MNHIVNFYLFLFLALVSCALYAPDQLIAGESFLAKPTKVQKKKRVSIYDVARAARDLNKETAGMMHDVAEVNECAGDCVSGVFEGPLANAKRETLRNLYEEVTKLTEHVSSERKHLKATVLQMRKLGSVN